MARLATLISICVMPVVALEIVLATAGIAVSEEKKDAAAQGPLLIAQLPPKPEAKKYNLRYKLKRGDVLRYDVTHRASIKSTIDETTQAAQTRTDSVKVWKVTDVLPEGEIEFMNVVERVHMMNQLPDRSPTEYDSTRDKTPPPGFEDAAKAVGVPLSTVRITPNGKIISRQMKIRGQGAEGDTPVALRLSDQPVAIGDTWDEPFDVHVKTESSGNKTIQTRRHHKLAEVKDGIATIEVAYQVLSPIDAQTEVQIVQRLMNGKVQFDIEKGRIVGQQMDIDKRILGFAGPTSSVQYLMKMEEKLLKEEPKTAAKPKSKTTASNRQPARSSKTASRPQTRSQPRSYRR